MGTIHLIKSFIVNIGRFRGVRGGYPPWPKIFGNKNAIKSEFLLPLLRPPLEILGPEAPKNFFEKSHFFVVLEGCETQKISNFWTKNGLKQAKNPLKSVKKGL